MVGIRTLARETHRKLLASCRDMLCACCLGNDDAGCGWETWRVFKRARENDTLVTVIHTFSKSSNVFNNIGAQIRSDNGVMRWQQFTLRDQRFGAEEDIEVTEIRGTYTSFFAVGVLLRISEEAESRGYPVAK